MEFGAKEQASRESGRYPWDDDAQRTRLLDWLSDARQRASEMSAHTTERARQMRDATGEYIHHYPFSTVALALAVGFVAGVLVARR